MAESVIEPLSLIKTSSPNHKDIKRLKPDNQRKLLDHHILIRDNDLEIFDSDDLPNLIELIMRDHTPEIIIRAILKVKSIDILTTLRILLDSAYQPILQVRIQELQENSSLQSA